MKLTARNTGWVGFDIGDVCVKAAQVVRHDGQYRIRSAAIVPRRQRWNPDELTAENPLPSADELQAAASICDRLSGRSAAVVLPMTLCETLQVETAACERDGGLREAVAAELHQELDDHVLGSWPAALQTGKLNVVTAPEAWSDQASGDVVAGRWTCRVVETLPWALARAVRMVEGAAERTVAALDLGYGRATLCLIHNGEPAMARCLKECGHAAALSAVEKSLRLPLHDAEILLATQMLCTGSAAVTDSDRAIAEALAGPLHQLERELRRTLSYWQSQARGVRPAAFYLFGGGASIRGLAEQLGALLEVDVSLWGLAAEDPQDAGVLAPPHLLGPALAASALAWE